MNGLLITGIISFSLSFAVLLSPIIIQSHDVPKCLYEYFVVTKFELVHEDYGSTIEKSEKLVITIPTPLDA